MFSIYKSVSTRSSCRLLDHLEYIQQIVALRGVDRLNSRSLQSGQSTLSNRDQNFFRLKLAHTRNLLRSS